MAKTFQILLWTSDEREENCQGFVYILVTVRLHSPVLYGKCSVKFTDRAKGVRCCRPFLTLSTATRRVFLPHTKVTRRKHMELYCEGTIKIFSML